MAQLAPLWRALVIDPSTGSRFSGRLAEPRAVRRRLPGMRRVALGLICLFALTACNTSELAPTPSPTAQPTAQPTETPQLRPLPDGLSGIPRPGTPTAVLAPQSRRGSIPPGVPLEFELGHCGLLAPIDFDGSLWNQIAGDDGSGGPLTDDHRGELFNATTVMLTLIEPDVAQMRTPLGAVITLVRHSGARPYNLCD